MSAYSDLRKAISKEVAQHAKAGVTLEWGTNSRTGEAIIRRGKSDARVIFSKSPSRYDKASAIGRVRRALRSVGVEIPPASPRKAPVAKPAKSKTQSQRIAALEAQVADLAARLKALEGAINGPAVAA